MNTLTFTASQQGYIDFINSNLPLLKLTEQLRKKTLHERATSGQQIRSSEHTSREIARLWDIETRAHDSLLTTRVNDIRKWMGMLPSSLNLHRLISKLIVDEKPRWLIADAEVKVHSYNPSELSIEALSAADPMDFIGGDVSEFAANYMKFTVRLFGIPKGAMSRDARTVYEKYTFLKHIGLAVGMAAYYNQRYNRQEKCRHYMLSLFNGTDILGHEYMAKFEELFNAEPIAEVFRQRHAGKDLPDHYILDAWSNCFAAYFTGYFLQDNEHSIAATTEPFSSALDDWMINFMYAFITRPH